MYFQRVRILLVLLATIFIGLESAHAFKIPIIKEISGLIIMEISIGGRPHKFVLDTGSNANFIDPTVVEEFEKAKNLIRKEDLDREVNTFNGRVKAKGYELNFYLGKFQFSKMATYAMNSKRFDKKNDGIDCCSGILGTPFIMEHALLVDTKKKNVSVFDPKSKEAKSLTGKLPFEIVGNNIIKVSCSVAGKPLVLRLDSGSEAPLVYHSDFTNNNSLLEKATLKGYHKGALFVDLGALECQGLKFNIDGFVYRGFGGALSHAYFDGNLGAQLLGKKYVIDMKKGYFLLEKSKNDLKISKNPYKLDLKEYTKTDIGALKQAEILLINSCAAVDHVEDCLKKWCQLEGMKCDIQSGTNDLMTIISTVFDKTKNDCSFGTLYSALVKDALKYNYCWWKNAFETKAKKEFLSVKKTIKNKKKLLKNVEYYVVGDQIKFTQRMYCYAVYSKLITTDSVPPSYFALSVRGMSLSKQGIEGYKEWSKTTEGEQCQSWINEKFGPHKLALPDLFSKLDYAIYVNPYTILGDGISGFDVNIYKTVSHENLHAIYAKFPKAKEHAKEIWEKASKSEKDTFKSEHPSYDFKNEETLYKEFFSYSYESSPEAIYKILGVKTK